MSNSKRARSWKRQIQPRVSLMGSGLSSTLPISSSPQGSLIPLNAQESLVLYRPTLLMRQARLPFLAQQLWLFELVHAG